jgi:hypothetical protein
MRIWDIPTTRLCRNHLLAEHRELHAIWSIILNGKEGYSRHPEVLRWHGKLGALWLRHEEQRKEMIRRGFDHGSPLHIEDIPTELVGDCGPCYLETPSEQLRRLDRKGCACDTGVAPPDSPEQGLN